MLLRNKKAQGGTELQLGFLQKRVDPKILDQVQICTSIPEKVPLHPTKVNILWQKNSYDQPNLHPWFKNKSNHYKYDWYVFNSHWSCEKFRMMFELPTEKCLVIKNNSSQYTVERFICTAWCYAISKESFDYFRCVFINRSVW